MTAFSRYGFDDVVHACSASPSTTGYFATLAGLPFHIHPIQTPAEWALLLGAVALPLNQGGIRPKPFVAPVIDPAAAHENEMAVLRARRDALLENSDWTQLADAPLSENLRTEWAEYRALLRALPQTFGQDPAAAIFPALPQ